MEPIYKRIQKVRIDAKLKKTQFSKEIGVSQAYISALESGTKSDPSSLFIKAVSLRFGISEEWLISGKGDMRPSATEISAGQFGITTKIDTGLLADCIAAVETVLNEKKKKWPPDKKSRFIALQYEYYLDSKKSVDLQEVANRFKLVA